MLVSEQLWRFNGQVEDTTHYTFFHPLYSAEHGSPPPLTTRDRELVSVLEVRIVPMDLKLLSFHFLFSIHTIEKNACI